MATKEDSISTTIPANDCSQDDKQLRQNWIKYVIGDPYAQDDPMELSMRRKQAIIFVVGLSGLTGHFASFIYLPGLLSVANDLNTSMEAVNGSVSTYLVFMGVAKYSVVPIPFARPVNPIKSLAATTTCRLGLLPVLYGQGPLPLVSSVILQMPGTFRQYIVAALSFSARSSVGNTFLKHPTAYS
ncbi:hypothetical protein BJV82DRAFT_675113 [Fennellomyces sp. T-0311]|nr:hypothetical protein BJV82DRAFT_675113 [Fennellomyces sp. T-0311]